MAKYGCPSSVMPPSNRRAMCGCSSRARIWRSRRKRAQDLLGVHAALEELERDALLELAVGALGEQHRAHAAAADLAHHLPAADPATAPALLRRRGLLRLAGLVVQQVSGVEVERGFQDARRPAVGGEQLRRPPPRPPAPRAQAAEPGVALLARQGDGLVESGAGAGPALRVPGRAQGASVGGELAIEKRARLPPLALHGAARDVEDVGRFVEGESAEEADLDQAGERRIDLRERRQRAVEREHLGGAVAGREPRFVDEDGSRLAAAALAGHPSPRAIDEDVTHGGRGEGEEVVPVAGRCGLRHEPEIRLVDERGGDERLAGGAARELDVGEAAQLVVDAGEGAVERAASRLRGRAPARG